MKKIVYDDLARDTFYDAENFVPFLERLKAEDVWNWEGRRQWLGHNEWGEHWIDHIDYVYLLKDRATVLIYNAAIEGKKSKFHSAATVTLVGDENQVNELESLILEEANKFQEDRKMSATLEQARALNPWPI